MASTLTESERQDRLGGVPGWTIENEALTRTFRFPDFVRAFGFMASAAVAAEKMNHHPNWSNVYDTVSVRLSTHDAGGITELDFELAATLSELAGD